MVTQKHKCMCRRELPAVVTLCHGQMDRVWPGTLRLHTPLEMGRGSQQVEEQAVKRPQTTSLQWTVSFHSHLFSDSSLSEPSL